MRIQLDTVTVARAGYSRGIYIQCDLRYKMDIYIIDTGIHGIPEDTVRYRRDTGEII